MIDTCEPQLPIVFKFIVLENVNTAKYIGEQSDIKVLASFAEIIPLYNSTQRNIALKKNVNKMIAKLKKIRDKL